VAPATSPRDRLRARLDEARDTAAYRAYEEAREHVLRMKELAAGAADAPSAYWTEELSGFEYMLDASPLIVEKLRHHTFHVTGLKVYDYRTGKDASKLAEKLRALEAIGGPELLVPESPALGGFGFELEGALYNVDTLKFYEAFIALQRGGVLGSLRGDERRLVVEVGSGWGGFAYQYRTLLPDTTYVMVDLPELFVFAGTYLRTLFPDASIHYAESADDLRVDLLAHDFVLVPHTLLDALAPPRLDLVLNMVSFQEMTTLQVERYVRWAHERGAPYLYSLNRDRSHYNSELSSVPDVLDRWFSVHEIPVLRESYTEMLGPPAKRWLHWSRTAMARRGMPYRHIVGWRRPAP